MVFLRVFFAVIFLPFLIFFFIGFSPPLMGPLWGTGRLYAIPHPMSSAIRWATQVASFARNSRGNVNAFHAWLTKGLLNYFSHAEKFNLCRFSAACQHCTQTAVHMVTTYMPG